MFLATNEKNEFIITHNDNKIIFKCLDENTFKAVQGYLFKINKKELEFYINTISIDRVLMIFSTGYKLLIPPLMGSEIMNRMILLNNKLKFPVINTQE
jgi:hypothetical protein